MKDVFDIRRFPGKRALQRIPEANLEWALRSYGPARRSSMQLVSRHAETGVDMRPHLPTSPANFETAILKDAEWYGSLYDRIKARFGAWLGE